MCVCCCRARPEKSEKPYPFIDFPTPSSGGYLSLPGYNYSYRSTENTFGYMQPVHSSGIQPTAPVQNPTVQFSHGSSSSNVPLVHHQKVDIRYERPPPYDS